MPGYEFSGKPTTTGWGPERIARAWIVLMKRLGYTRYAAQGGETCHHDYAKRNPTQGYIMAVSTPKVRKLEQYFPDS